MNEFNKEEFRIVYHRELNNSKLDLEELCRKTDNLQEKTERKLITAPEGDIIVRKVKGTKDQYDIYMAHTLYAGLYPETIFKNIFDKEGQQGKAAHFYDVINNLNRIDKTKIGPVDLDVELKDSLNPKIIEYAIKAFQSTGIPFYIASFYGENLDMTYETDPNVRRARHVMKTIDDKGYNIPVLGMNAPRYEPTINIVQHANAKGNPTKIMYTPEHTPEQLIILAQNENVRGAFTSLKLF